MVWEFRRFASIPLALLVSAPLAAAPAPYRIDPEHFSIAFLIEHIGYERLIGQFTQASGEFVYDEQAKQLRSGLVEVRAASVTTHHDRRDAHVRSGDFLDTGKHPVIRFVAREYRSSDSGSEPGTLRGELTMLGQTHPVGAQGAAEQSSEVSLRSSQTHARGFGERDDQRSRWGMTYGVANGMVGDKVELLFEFEALRQ